MDKIALVTGSKDTAIALENQLKVFLTDKVKINCYISDDGITHFNDESIMVFSSQALHDEVSEMMIIPSTEKIIGNRTVNYDMLDGLVALPSDVPILLVNDLEESAKEVRVALLEIGLDHLDLTLFYPGCSIDTSAFEIAITPGENRYVPSHIKQTYDIGSRIFDFRTIAKLLSRLNLLEHSSGSFSKMYLEKIIKIARGLAVSRAEVVKLNENLEQVIHSFNAGLLMYDHDNRIIVCNEVLKKILKINKYKIEGNSVQQIIQNKRLLRFMLDEPLENHLEVTLDGTDFIVDKFKVTDNEINCVTIKSIQGNSLIRDNAFKKGHIAKYTLDDIVGQSETITRLKAIITKLAKTDMNVLIQGESGTGKELTASAIHNHSSRAEAPFLAVNFSALSDDLIESELFGYAEGAFTGAKKGGKVGLFEEANGGTIFLDEIGDISLKVQLRLLRVLEEREIMPIGSNEIKPIDVRIVAATNKDLEQLIKEKRFREDLYYRLKMGFIKLQPLRNRREDIPELIKHMAQLQASSEVSFSDALMRALKAYEWSGNIRELKNTLTYMLAVREVDQLSVNDLPDDKVIAFEENSLDSHEEVMVYPQDEKKPLYLNEEQTYFIKLILQMLKQDHAISRTSLAKMSENGPFVRTENQVRRILNQLESLDLITLNRGRRGIMPTANAYQWKERG